MRSACSGGTLGSRYKDAELDDVVAPLFHFPVALSQHIGLPVALSFGARPRGRVTPQLDSGFFDCADVPASSVAKRVASADEVVRAEGSAAAAALR